MMVLIRTCFWLLVLVLLLPTDENQQNQIFGTAQTAMNDLAGFCDRNPQTCLTSQETFEVLVKKAQYGAQLVMSLVDEQTAAFDNTVQQNGTAPQPVSMPNDSPITKDGSVMPVPAVTLEPMTLDTSASKDTLGPEDLETAWKGPGI